MPLSKKAHLPAGVRYVPAKPVGYPLTMIQVHRVPTQAVAIRVLGGD